MAWFNPAWVELFTSSVQKWLRKLVASGVSKTQATIVNRLSLG
jgi:hypothetical protein